MIMLKILKRLVINGVLLISIALPLHAEGEPEKLDVPNNFDLKIIAPVSMHQVGPGKTIAGPALAGGVAFDSRFFSWLGASGSFVAGPSMKSEGGFSNIAFGGDFLFRFEPFHWESDRQEFVCENPVFGGCWGEYRHFDGIDGVVFELGTRFGQAPIVWGTLDTQDSGKLKDRELYLLWHPMLGVRWFTNDPKEEKTNYTVGAYLFYGPLGVPGPKSNGLYPASEKISSGWEPVKFFKNINYPSLGGMATLGIGSRWLELKLEVGGGENHIVLGLSLAGIFHIIGKD